MKELEERIAREGIVRQGNVLKVDSFLNHRCDVELYSHMAQEWRRLFDGEPVDKILTIESSGIGLACVAAQQFGNVPVVFARKSESVNLNGSQYRTKIHSYTHGRDYSVIVAKRFLTAGEHVLIIDDFLANGEAALGASNLLERAGAQVAGIGIVIAKTFQPGLKKLQEAGYRVEILAPVKRMAENLIEFD